VEDHVLSEEHERKINIKKGVLTGVTASHELDVEGSARYGQERGTRMVGRERDTC
jgi:hypothetical protein